jgi:hypothetical protein
MLLRSFIIGYALGAIVGLALMPWLGLANGAIAAWLLGAVFSVGWIVEAYKRADEAPVSAMGTPEYGV